MYRRHAKLDDMNMVGGRRIRPSRRIGPPLHRIAQVMQQEQVKPRTVARRLGTTEMQVRVESQPSSDLTLSRLYRWQQAIDVPVADLLVEPGPELSPPVQRRCGLLKAMRTARSMVEHAENDAVQSLAIQLVQQLLGVMPELSHVTSWPSVGQRRTLDEMGAITERTISDDLFQGESAEG